MLQVAYLQMAGSGKHKNQDTLFNGTIKINPLAIDLHVGFINMPFIKTSMDVANTTVNAFLIQVHSVEPNGK